MQSQCYEHLSRTAISLVNRRRLEEWKRQEREEYKLRIQNNAKVTYHFFEFRRDLAHKCYEMTEKLKLDFGTVEVTIRYMDKLAMELDTSLLLEEAEQRYKATGTAAFIIAMKASNSKKQAAVSEIPDIFWKDEFASISALEQAELELLLQLNFQVHPPTASSFARALLSLVPSDMLATPQIQESTNYSSQNGFTSIVREIETLAQSQINLALGHRTFVSYSPSEVGTAALLNAIQSLLPNNHYELVKHVLNIPGSSLPAIEFLREKLSKWLLRHIVASSEEVSAAAQQFEEHPLTVPSTIVFCQSPLVERRISSISHDGSSRSVLSS